MNILLTGGAGYIGSHTATVLIESGFNLTLLDDLSNSKIDVISRLEEVTLKRICFVEGDIRDTPLVSSVLKKYSIDLVMHFAAVKSVSESVLNPMKYFNNNVGGAISLLKAMQENNIKNIVFSSSATVYGNPQYLPIDEVHPTSAINPYGHSKLIVEEMLRDIVASDTSWHVTCLRYFNPIGAHSSGLIGESPLNIPNNLMPYLLNVALGKLPYLNVYGNDYETKDGTGVRDYIHVMDLARGHLAALNFLKTNAGFNVFNLGTGKGFSVLDVVNTFERVTGKCIDLRVAPRRAGDVAFCYASVNKANDVLSWRASETLDSMCESAWNFQRKILCNNP
jgi:UDP-glucose 4-epimerase